MSKSIAAKFFFKNFFKKVGWVGFFLGLFLLDFFSKKIVHNTDNYLINRGFSFGFFSNNFWQICLTVFFILFFLKLIWQRNRAADFPQLPTPSLILILVGALGNLLDRFLYGGVVDWLPLFFGYKNNLADWYVFVGVISLLVVSFLKLSLRPKNAKVA